MSERDTSAGARQHVTGGFPGRFHPAAHGHEPDQEDLGPHPANECVGYVDDPEQPERFTMNARGATAEDIINEYYEIGEQQVVDLGDLQ